MTREQKLETMLKKACECILSGSSWETVCDALTRKTKADDWCNMMDCDPEEPVPIECVMHYLQQSPDENKEEEKK